MLKRILIGLMFTFGGTILVTVGNLLLVPLYLVVWGSNVYGEWLALSAAVSYLGLFDLGMQMYAVNLLTRHYARGELETYTNVLQSALRTYLVIAAAGAVMLSAVIALAPVARWLNLTSISPPEARLIVGILGVQVLIAVPLGFVDSLYRSFQELPRAVAIGNLERLALIALPVAGLALGVQPALLAGMLILPQLVVGGYVLADLRRRHPEIVVGVARGDWRMGWSMVGPSMLFLLIPLGATVILQTTTLVVSTLAGATAVALFVITRTLANATRQLVGPASGVIWPEVTVMEARGEIDRLRGLLVLFTKVVTAVAIAAAASLLSAGPDVISFWTARRIEPDRPLLVLFCVHTVLQTPWFASAMFGLACSRQREVGFIYVALSAATVFLLGAALLVPSGDVIHVVVLATIVADLLTATWLAPRLGARLVGRSLGWYAREVLVPGALISGPIVTAGWALGLLGANPWIRVLFVPLGLCVAVALVTWRAWLSRDERRKVADCILAVARRVGSLFRTGADSDRRTQLRDRAAAEVAHEADV